MIEWGAASADGGYNGMGNHGPIVAFLGRRRQAEDELSCRDFERMVGILPKAALRPDWWVPDVTPQDAPQKRALAAAGYRAEVLLKQERVRIAQTRQR